MRRLDDVAFMFCPFGWVELGVGDTPPRVFCKKRLELLENKGVDFFGEGKEAARDWRERR